MTTHDDDEGPPSQDRGASVPAGPDLSTLSLHDLLSELANIRDRINHDPGYQHLPGQTRRRATLLKRERLLVAEVRRRSDGDAAPAVDEPLASS